MEDVSGVGSDVESPSQDGQVYVCEELALAKSLHLHRPRLPYVYNRIMGQRLMGLEPAAGPRPCLLPGLTERTPLVPIVVESCVNL